MKLLPLLAFACLQIAARADMVIVQKVEGGGQSGEMTMKFKDNKIRADVSQGISTITDATSGDVITIMAAQKTYMNMPAASTRAMMEQAVKSQPGASPSSGPPKLVASGRKDKINGYDCEEYTCDIGGMKVSYWLAPKFPDWQKVLAAMNKFQQGSLAAMTKSFTPNPSDFTGMPIKTDVDMNGQKITTTLVSVKEQPLDAADFSVPAGFTEMKMPSFNGPPSAP